MINSYKMVLMNLKFWKPIWPISINTSTIQKTNKFSTISQMLTLQKFTPTIYKILIHKV